MERHLLPQAWKLIVGGPQPGLAKFQILAKTMKVTSVIRQFSNFDYLVKGQGESLEVQCVATRLEDKKQVKGSAVSMRMARQEGWTKNPKYSSMPELMLRNRAATFFGRQYIPDLLLGVQTSEEVVDIESEPINVSESSVRIEPQQEDENDIGF